MGEVTRPVRAEDKATLGEHTSVMISYALWVQWFEIAVEQEGQARAARAEAVAVERRGLDAGPALGRELTAGLITVSAVAHALDALYGQLVTDQLKAQGPKEDAKREAHIRECLKRRFHTGGKRDKAWVPEFRWLFDLRDAAVHAKVVLRPSVPHPSGITNAGQENLDYSVEAGMRAVDLLCDVLTTCIDNPKPTDADAKVWAANYASGFRAIETRLRIGREAQPLVSGCGEGPGDPA